MRHLVIMVKEPRPGRVKTRLGRDVGMVASAHWFRRQSAALIGRVTDPRWRTYLAVSPDHAGLQSRVWPQHLPRVPQGSGDLGDRMGRIFRSMPPGPVCIIGADIPGITASRVWEGFRALGGHDAVFGPAYDGGYWMVGLKRTQAVPYTMFDHVRWSTQYALEDTRRSLGNMRVAHTNRLRDVDTATDLALFDKGVAYV